MRKLGILILTLVVVHVAFLFVHPAGGAEATQPHSGTNVGIVFDVGGRGDKSFNDGAYAGAQLATKELGAHFRFIEPGDGSDREAGLRLLAAEGMDLVVGVGFIFTDDLNALAKEYPNTKFAGIDYSVSTDAQGNPLPPPPNLAALKFREEQGSFLVGALAALVSKTHKLGFVGGMDVPLIHRFEVGYEEGARAMRPDVRVIPNYVGVTETAWNDPVKAGELARSQIGKGAEVVFAAAGNSGLGAFDAVEALGKDASGRPRAFVIGVDSDQNWIKPGYVLTSMVKRVDNAVYQIVQDRVNGRPVGGVHVYGLDNQGVDYALDQFNKPLIPDSVLQRVEEARKKIGSGAIVVTDAMSK